ncbi:M23 family metallopeptidase [Pseudoalteromonas sp. C2R02]|uniref:M23 family metallopeptidase n=1 Tax=Pseudoalteromonas sp. C2R02 TaxID=2841565 RepID=UPI001C096094|nr:M23 family metallopeptidase [Pseudoalteromonas sp. C2R02]MBU2968251.1 M23 family metallopeptidase [Pseudoalteromonas sp. C2R02]
MKTTILPILTSCLITVATGTNAQVHFDNHDTIEFDEKKLQNLPINALLVIDNDKFVFSNTQLNEDWDHFFNTQATALKHKQEVIMHWAGYTSINPKILIALMDQQSEILNNAKLNAFTTPFGQLSTKKGFDNQLQDIALRLSKHFYLFLEAQENNNITTNKLKNTTAATVSISNLLKLSKANTFKIDTKTTSNFVNHFHQLFTQNKDSLLLQNALIEPDNKVNNINTAANFYMSFPWPSGYAWYSGGAHSNTGSGYPYSSLDFNNNSGGWGSNTPWIQASHGGVVTKYSNCNMRITHSSGYATSYYHMDNLQYRTGDSVQTGAWLGRYANNKQTALCEGGQSSGPHVHFSLLYNGRYTSLHNHYISGYRVDVGNYNYDDNCNNFYFSKNGYKTCAWRQLWR